MSEMSIDDVRRVAQLANLSFSEAELDQMRADMSVILDYVELLNQAETDNVEPMAHPIDVKNVFREDEPTEMLPLEKALENAPATDGRYFVVPAILDAEE